MKKAMLFALIALVSLNAFAADSTFTFNWPEKVGATITKTYSNSTPCVITHYDDGSLFIIAREGDATHFFLIQKEKSVQFWMFRNPDGVMVAGGGPPIIENICTDTIRLLPDNLEKALEVELKALHEEQPSQAEK